MPKEDFFGQSVEPEVMAQLRDALLVAEGNSPTAKARAVCPQFPQWSQKTLIDFSLMLIRATPETFQLYLDKKISVAALGILARWDPKDQDFMAKEYVDRKMEPGDLRKVRLIQKEQGVGFGEAIPKAMGEMPVHQPRESKPRTFDSVLDDMNKHSARWRAPMSMALDLISEEEAKAGIHNLLFQRAYMLRHTIKENLDFATSKVNRYIGFIRKKYKAAAETSSDGSGFMEGEIDGDTAGSGEKRVGREAGDAEPDGQPFPDRPEQG